MPDRGPVGISTEWTQELKHSGSQQGMLRVKSNSELTPDDKRRPALTEAPNVTISRVEKRSSSSSSSKRSSEEQRGKEGSEQDSMSSSPDIKRGLGMESLSPPGASSGIKTYSDFMRSLAAKYNNNEYFTPTSRGIPEPRLPSIKPAMNPFLGFPHSFPPGFPGLGLPGLHNPSKEEGKHPLHFAMEPSQALMTLARSAGVELPGLAGLNLPTPAPPPPVPGPPGGLKRPRGDAPLDLTDKRIKMEQEGANTDGDSNGSGSPRPGLSPSIQDPAGRQGISQSNGHDPTILSWTVEDVVSLVASIDICREYQQAFRDHNIDGSSLPLLTETHMTSQLGMKLGPALKLKTVLRRKLGPELGVLCSHCAHCHQGEERARGGDGRGRKQSGEEALPRPGSGSSLGEKSV